MNQKERQVLQKVDEGVKQILGLLQPDIQPKKSEELSIKQLLDQMEYLRSVVKYTLLDLEATRREKSALEKKLRGNK